MEALTEALAGETQLSVDCFQRTGELLLVVGIILNIDLTVGNEKICVSKGGSVKRSTSQTTRLIFSQLRHTHTHTSPG